MAIATEKKVIIIDEEDRNAIMRANIEMDATANIIAKIITEDLNIDSDRFHDYEDHYNELYAEYKKLQDYIADKYINSDPILEEKAIGWKLNYNNCELTVDVTV